MSAGIIGEGVRLGCYLLKHSLGEGGSGQVWKAWKDNATKTPIVVVLKFPLQRAAMQASINERYLQEAEIAMKLNACQNILQVTDAQRHLEMAYIVLEYVDGTDLEIVLEKMRRMGKRMSLSSTFNILFQIATALNYAHVGAIENEKSIGVIHRDVNPANIMVSLDGLLKLGDFGISTTAEDGTTGNHMRGTTRYMSPEHVRCELGPEMDIYSLGVIAWELVENRVYCHERARPIPVDPNDGAAVARENERARMEHITAILNGDAPSMTHPNTPPGLISLIKDCLAGNPRRRPTASQFIDSLTRCPDLPQEMSAFVADIVLARGSRRTSGRTLDKFTFTPELIATMSALEARELERALQSPVGKPAALLDARSGREADAPTFFHRDRPIQHSPTPASPPMSSVSLAEMPPSERTEVLPPLFAPREPPVPQPKTTVLRSVPKRRQWRLIVLPLGLAAVGAAVLVAWPDTPSAMPVSTSQPHAAVTPRESPERAPSHNPPLRPVDVQREHDGPIIPTSSTPVDVEPQSVVSTVPSPKAPTSLPPTNKPKRRHAEKIPAAISVTLVLDLIEGAEVKIGRRTLTVVRKREIKVPAGHHRLRWRVLGDEAWHDKGRMRFTAKGGYLLRLNASSPKLSELPARTR
ncbi:MAG: protein kinase [Nannocystaceae bacterium]|nr:protein kinase [Nannocystaceae bacterium]